MTIYEVKYGSGSDFSLNYDYVIYFMIVKLDHVVVQGLHLILLEIEVLLQNSVIYDLVDELVINNFVLYVVSFELIKVNMDLLIVFVDFHNKVHFKVVNWEVNRKNHFQLLS